MRKWNLIIDVATCTNCNACTLAVHDEHVGNAFPGYAAEMPRHGHRWIEIRQRERGQAPMVDVAYLPVPCQHCDDAPCIEAARDGAVKKRADGIVIIDPDRAKGQKQIVDACPYGAVYWNEELELPQHWIFDAHLLDAGWKGPRCEQVCVTGAMRAIAVEDAEMRRIVAAEGLQELEPELRTRPRVHYKNLYRYRKCFIGGTVVAAAGGVVDCVEGATVALQQDGGTIGEAITDNYGDFKIDRLEPDSGAYRVAIEMAGYPAKSIDVTLGQSAYLGRITL